MDSIEASRISSSRIKKIATIPMAAFALNALICAFVAPPLALRGAVSAAKPAAIAAVKPTMAIRPLDRAMDMEMGYGGYGGYGMMGGYGRGCARPGSNPRTVGVSHLLLTRRSCRDTDGGWGRGYGMYGGYGRGMSGGYGRGMYGGCAPSSGSNHNSQCRVRPATYSRLPGPLRLQTAAGAAVVATTVATTASVAATAGAARPSAWPSPATERDSEPRAGARQWALFPICTAPAHMMT